MSYARTGEGGDWPSISFTYLSGQCPECAGTFPEPASRGVIACENGHGYRVDRRTNTVVQVPDELVGHVIDDEGVHPTFFARNTGLEFTNTEQITIKPGGVLDLGNGMVIKNPAEPVEFTYDIEREPPA